MADCSTCGASNPDLARFCLECGAAVAAVPARGDVRKVVTVLFIDLSGSTALGERLDPETVRAVMGRYFTLARVAIEAHGGVVEKFIGDAVMAVFGIPQLHEDDAVRAVRAAAAVRASLDELNQDLEKRHGLKLQTRTGINTGEVIAGDPAGQTLVTGDAVNTAARLEQAAQPGSIVIGELTYRLAREAIEATALEPIHAKGKSAPISAYRVDRVFAVGADRDRASGRLVGRESELATLMAAYEVATSTGNVRLVTVLAHPGVGKSRLLRELTARLPSTARVIRGRCLPYGQSTAHRPMREALGEVSGLSDADAPPVAMRKLHALVADDPDAQAIAAGLAFLIRAGDVTATQDEAFWAARRAMERMAHRNTLVAVFEDLHWADPAFLDLLEYIVDLSANAPMLIVATARPDLIEARAGWGSGRSNAEIVRLDSLDLDDAAALCREQVGGTALPDSVVERIVQASEGNPLFVEEMISMLRDDGLLRRTDGEWVLDRAEVGIPPTIRALIASRLDRLPDDARRVAEHAAVIGRAFESVALAHIAPQPLRAALTGHLLTLVRRELIRPSRLEVGAGDAFEFRHALIRDAAYAALPKRGRAELHERLADWFEAAAGVEGGQFQEVIAHHLEQAYRYRSALGETDARARTLAQRGAALLFELGHRSYEAGAVRHAADTFQRAVDLLGPDATAQLLLMAGDSRVRAGDEAGFDLLQSAVDVAKACGDASTGAAARATLASFEGAHGRLDALEAIETIETAIAELEPFNDPPTLSRAYGALAFARWGTGRLDGGYEAAKVAIRYAREAGNESRAARLMAVATGMVVDGPTPIPDGMQWCIRALAEVGESRNAQYPLLETMGWLHAARGSRDEALACFAEALAIAEDLGQLGDSGFIRAGRAVAELSFGRLDAAEHEARAALERLETFGAQALIAASTLSKILTAQGRPAHAIEVLESRPAPPPSDIYLNAQHLTAKSLALSLLGRVDEARRLAAEALEILEPTDVVVYRAEAIEAQAAAELAGKNLGEVRRLLSVALGIYRAKQSTVATAALEARLSKLAVE